jgi:PAS domain S-box-containing protein
VRSASRIEGMEMKGYLAETGVRSATRLTFLRYLGAILCIAGAVSLAWWLQPVVDETIVLLMAVVLAAWFSGLWPALVASVLATLALDYFFTPPLFTFSAGLANIPRLVSFTVIAALFAGASAKRRSAEQSLKQVLDELDAKVRERTADLTTANERFLDLVNSIEGIVWEAHATTLHFTFVSKQAERVLGYPVEQWLRDPTFWRDHLHPEDRDAAVNACVAATVERRDHDLEYRMVTAGGRVVWLRDLITVIVERGEATRLRGVMLDITARKQAEEMLHEQANLLDLTHDTIFVRDMNDVIRYWNRGAEELYGWSPDEAMGQVSHRLTQTIFSAPLDEINATLFQTGRWEGELRHSRRDGSQVIVASRWSLQRDSSGTPIAILESNNDITPRKRAEAELRDSERRHRHIFQAAGVSIWEEDFSRVKQAIDAVRVNGGADFREYLRRRPEFIDEAISLVRIVDVNEATLKLFGARSKSELLESLRTVFTPETREVFAGELIAVAEGSSSFEGETILRKLNGDRIVALFSVSFSPADAALDAVLVSIIDITDRKRAEQELEDLAGRLIHAQEQERSRIGRELHDHVSQMLGVLTIRLDQLRAAASTPPHVAAEVAELRQSTAEITQDIHDLSHRLHSSALDYLGLVPAVQRLVSEFSARHGIAIEFTHASVPTPLPTDVALCLFRVTEESLANVAKHSRAQSARVHLRGAADGMHLTVEDTGAGFDVKTLEQKAGLGFISMRERLRVLGGTVRIDSAPSRGTRIDVRVPAKSVAASPAGSVTTHRV